MSALEPDAPGDHVFAAAREAIRAWWSHRKGKEPTRAALGSPRGKPCTMSDALRVARVLAGMGLVFDPPCHRTKQLVCWAFETVERREIETLVKRAERHLRASGIVAQAREIGPIWRGKWADTEGQEHETAQLLEIS